MPPATSVTYNQPAPAPTTEMTIKKEDLASLFAEFTKTLIGTLNQNQGSSN